MLVANCWKHVRNLPNVIRHTQYMFDNVTLTSDNVLSVLKQQTGPWCRYETYEQQQLNLTNGIMSTLLSNQADIKEEKLFDATLDVLCDINDDIEFTNATTRADISKLVVKHKLRSYEWYLCLAKNGQPFGYGILNYRHDKLPETFEQTKTVLEEHGYFIDYDPNGIGMKQSFKGFYDNPYKGQDGTLQYDADLNIDKYDKRNSPALLYKFGQYVTSKIIDGKDEQKKKRKKEQDDNNASVVAMATIATIIAIGF
jgi:hypothetical protein